MKWNIIVGSLVLGLGLSAQSFGFDLLDRMLGMNYDGCSSKASCCETKFVDPGCDDGCASPCGSSTACCDTPILDAIRSHVCKLKSIRIRDHSSCEAKCSDPGCGAEPSCGCDTGCVVDPGCGCDDGCDTGCAAKPLRKRCRIGLLDRLRSHCRTSCDSKCGDPGCGAEPSCGCDTGCVVDPGCGCDDGCDTGCAAKPCRKRCRVSLLDRIFSHRCSKKTGCCEPSCGCDTGCEPTCGCEPSCGCDNGCGDVAPIAPAPAKAPKKAAKKVTATPPAPVVDPSAFLPTKRHFIQANLVS